MGKDGNFGGAGERSAVSLAGGDLLLEAGGGAGGGDDDTKGGDGYRSAVHNEFKDLDDCGSVEAGVGARVSSRGGAVAPRAGMGSSLLSAAKVSTVFNLFRTLTLKTE